MVAPEGGQGWDSGIVPFVRVHPPSQDLTSGACELMVHAARADRKRGWRK